MIRAKAQQNTTAGASSSSSSFDDKSQREGLWGAKGGCFFGKVPSRVSLLGSRVLFGRRLRMSRIILSVSKNFFFFFVKHKTRESKRDLLFRVLPRTFQFTVSYFKGGRGGGVRTTPSYCFFFLPKKKTLIIMERHDTTLYSYFYNQLTFSRHKISFKK